MPCGQHSPTAALLQAIAVAVRHLPDTLLDLVRVAGHHDGYEIDESTESVTSLRLVLPRLLATLAVAHDRSPYLSVRLSPP